MRKVRQKYYFKDELQPGNLKQDSVKPAPQKGVKLLPAGLIFDNFACLPVLTAGVILNFPYILL